MGLLRHQGLRAVALVLAALGCDEPPPGDDAIEIGVVLSYTGYLAASSINSERALAMSIEAANRAGGVSGRPLRMRARDTRSNAGKANQSIQRLLDANLAAIIGPDTTDLITYLAPELMERTLLLPSLNTSGDVRWKSSSWFIMGPSLGQVGCGLLAQMNDDGRRKPLILFTAAGYTTELAWDLTNHTGLSKQPLPSDLTADGLRTLANVIANSDSYILAAFPSTASKLMYGLASIGALPDPTRWYLSPVLHTPAFLESMPRGLVDGARGVSSGTVAGAAAFRIAFTARWQDDPMDDAFPFYDAGALAILAIQRAIIQEGAVPTGTGLSRHIIAVTRSGGTPVGWNEIDRGLELLRDGQEVTYFGLSGPLEFDSEGRTRSASTTWWKINEGAFQDMQRTSDCVAVQ
jgi:ABC-type branched-subunit amino acid transport system substrate-binding protein